ncbi:hypothetical protein E1A91_A08G083800v1 [Gossypium mustelinum]|uniref:Putative plant transposon protein domain-containing protein n=1 Tax=Gossypium mustelinum TaxID=34275 RepID=A0A5D2Y6E8_GOSMU|nr:hypothetical protein E1A91_A08G083800v1 [Gossypium mustelinum]
MNERTFIQEWGFNPSLTGCDNIGELVDFHHRRNFCSTLNEPVVDVIVYEFYASLKDREIHKIPSEIHMHVMVRGKKVLATPREIYFYYDAPYYASDLLDYVDLNMYRGIDMDAILRYLTQGCGELTRQVGTNIHVKFTQAIMFPMAKMWMQFICTCISRTQNISHVTTFRAVLLHSIFIEKTGMRGPVDLSRNDVMY